MLAEAEKPRAVKVTINDACTALVASQVFPEGSSLGEDFAAIAASCEDTVPCFVLVRLEDAAGSVPGAGPKHWAMLAWTPDDAPRKLRMLSAASRKVLLDAFGDLSFQQYPATEKGELTLEEFVSKTRPLTEEERLASMTHEEIVREEAKKAMDKEQQAAPMKLAGLVALQLKRTESFDQALESALAGEGKAVLAKLGGAKGEDLDGAVLDDVAAPSALKGKLPTNEPCYVVLSLGDRILVLSWMPNEVPAKLRMKYSTFKASCIKFVREAAGSRRVASADVTEEEDLADDLGAAAAEEPEDRAAATGEAKKPGGFKPPVGGFRMPGM